MTLKQKVYASLQQLLQDKIDIFRDRISALTEDSKNDAKGSAGDKHETALSMMHLEQEKTNYKLQEFLQQQAILNRIDINQQALIIGLGSLVQVNQMWVFMSVALPKITIDNKTIFALSPQSPLGLQIIGKKIGFEFEMNGTAFKIENVE